MTHPPQREVSATFNDGGLWRNLLVEGQKGATIKPFFVVEIAEGCNLHTAKYPKLGLPPRFLDHHCKSLSETITLEGPDGQKWLAMLGLSWKPKSPGILDGWRQFAADYTLDLSDQIVFFLLKDSHFLVQVFDEQNNIKGRGTPTADRGERMGLGAMMSRQAKTYQRREKIAAMDVRVQATVKLESGTGDANRPAHCSTIGDNLKEIDSTEEDELLPLIPVNWERAPRKPTATGSPIKASGIKLRPKMVAPKSNYIGTGTRENLLLHNRPNSQGAGKRPVTAPLDRPASEVSKTRGA